MRRIGVDVLPPDSAGAFERWATAATRPLFRSAWLLTGDWHRAEDLVQDTLARLYGSWGRRSIDNPTAYAHTVLARLFISQRRRRSSSERPIADVPDGFDAATGDPELRRTLIAALATLPSKDRAVLVLRYFADLPVDEVARRFGGSPGAVRVQAMRALAKLRAALGDDLLDLARP
jgi:RNA polymerase sigma-70 factor (sigma-E family)